MRLRVIAALLLLGFCARADVPLVFPVPQELVRSAEAMVFTPDARILVVPHATNDDRFLAEELQAELSDHYGVAVPIQETEHVPASGKVIVLGTTANPLVVELLARHALKATDVASHPEGYRLEADGTSALVAGVDAAGAFYGLQSLRQLLHQDHSEVMLLGASIRDWPYKPFRGLKLYLPGRDHIPFFKRMVRDFMALYKYNTLILEMNAGMRLVRHPELNAGWIDFGRDLIATRRDRPLGPRGEGMDSTHHDTADGAVLEQDEVADLVRWARRYHIDVIPEVPSLTHSYYLLTRHPELAEVPGAEWPDAYCPSNPKSYDLLFDVLDEYIAVMQPRMMHVGHDEWRVTVGACPLCRGHDYRELFMADLNKIHHHLRARNIDTMIWGDHLIEELRGKRVAAATSATGFKYERPGGLSPEQVSTGVPKDITIANWFWADGHPGQGEINDQKLEGWGFRQVYGNLEPDIANWAWRSARPSVLGGAPSSWAATTEFNIGKDHIRRFLGCSNLLWSTHWPSEAELTFSVQAMMPDVRARLHGITSHHAERETPVDVPMAGPDGAPVRVAAGQTAPPVLIGRDVDALVFVHASERKARNAPAYRLIHDFEDTADLLGFYEVEYDDGLVVTIPVRYGVNVLETSWGAGQGDDACCYLADPTVRGSRTYFSFKWPNPRLGRPIKSVSCRGVASPPTSSSKTIPANAILWQGLQIIPAAAGKPAAKTNRDE